MDNTVKEPLIHLSKREDMPSGKRWLVRIAAIFLSLVVCAGFIFMIIKMNPVEVYEGIVEGAVGTSRRFWVTARAVSYTHLSYRSGICRYQYYKV